MKFRLFNLFKMERAKFLIIGLFLVNLFGCKDQTVTMHYNFLDASELSEININQDSAMHFQEIIGKLKTYDEFIVHKYVHNNFYIEIDTVSFLTEMGDTIIFKATSQLVVNEVTSYLSRTDTQISVSSNLEPLEHCFISSIGYDISKSSTQKNMSLVDRFLGASLSNNSITQDFAYTIQGRDVNKIEKKGFVVTYEPYLWAGDVIDSCLIIKQYDISSNEIFKMVYSRKDGFLQIRNILHEIRRLSIN